VLEDHDPDFGGEVGDGFGVHGRFHLVRPGMRSQRVKEEREDLGRNPARCGSVAQKKDWL
jgi:hypothetical protein